MLTDVDKPRSVDLCLPVHVFVCMSLHTSYSRYDTIDDSHWTTDRQAASLI